MYITDRHDRGLHQTPVTDRQTDSQLMTMRQTDIRPRYFLLRLTDDPIQAQSGLKVSDILIDVVEREVNTVYPYLCVRETGKDDKNPHIHFAFSPSSTDSLEAVRKRIQRNWKGSKALWSGNECHELKLGIPEKLDSHFDYLCKGITSCKEDPVEILFRHSDFTDAAVEERKCTYYKVAETIPGQKGKRKRATAVQEIYEACVARNILSHQIDLIEDEAHHFYRRSFKYLDPRYYRNLIHTVSVYLDPDGNTRERLRAFVKVGWCDIGI